MKMFFSNIWNLYKKHEEIINYLIIGFLTTLISLLIYYVLVFTIINPNKPIELQIANISSWIGAVIFAYFTNRIFVFKSKDKNVTKESSKFFVARLITLLIDILFMFITVSVLHLNDKVMKIVDNILVIVLNYIFSKLYVFIKK